MPNATLSTWMSLVPDSTSLAAINLPGTRTSLSYLLPAGDPDRIQTVDLAAQLARGCRLIEVDCDATNGTDKAQMRCFVGSRDVGSFDVVTTAVSAFLTAHPSETVVLLARSGLKFGLLPWAQAFNNARPAVPLLATWAMVPFASARGKLLVIRTFDGDVYPPILEVPAWVAIPWSNAKIQTVGSRGFVGLEQDINPIPPQPSTSATIDAKWRAVLDLQSQAVGFDGVKLFINVAGGEGSVAGQRVPSQAVWNGSGGSSGIATRIGALAGDALPNELIGAVLLDDSAAAPALLRPVVRNYLAWSPQVTANDPRTTRAPWLVAYQGLLIAIHEDAGSNGRLVFSSRPLGGSGWSGNKPIGGPTRDAMTSGPASAIVVDDGSGSQKLFVFYEGNNNEGWLHLSVFDGRAWTDPTTPIQPSGSAFGTRGAPGLAFLNGLLHCVRRGQDGHTMWWATYDPIRRTWSNDHTVAAIQMTGSPALLAGDGGLHLIHQGSNYDGNIWSSVFNGASWSKDTQLFADGVPLRVSETPALAQVGNLTYLICEESGDRGGMLVTAAHLGGAKRWGRQMPCRDTAGNGLTTRGRPGLYVDASGAIVSVTERPAVPGRFAEAVAAPLPNWTLS